VREASLLRPLICGSVDDGTSTLRRRCLFDSNAILDDPLEALAGIHENPARTATIAISPAGISPRRGDRSSSLTRRATSSPRGT
jgi:hypothetical protein